MVNYKDIDRIVAFGCSFTAGTELLDYTLDERYYKLKKTLSAFDWYNVIYKDSRAHQTLKDNREKEKYITWPAKLAENLSLDFLSFAQPGNSNEKILWQIERSIFDGTITDRDLILVGQTGPHRNMYFTNKHKEPTSFLLSNEGSIKPIFQDSLYKWFNDSRIFWDHIRFLDQLRFIKSRLNGRLLAVHMELPFNLHENHYWGLDDLGYQTDFFKFKLEESIHSDLFIDKSLYMYQFVNDENILEHGHPNETVHQNFADALIKLFYK